MNLREISLDQAADAGLAVLEQACVTHGISTDLLTPFNVYGVPRGGLCMALLVSSCTPCVTVVDKIEDATFILDDLIDSGSTRDKYAARYPDIPFVAVYTKEDPSDWFVFPWELNDDALDDIGVRVAEYVGVSDPKSCNSSYMDWLTKLTSRESIGSIRNTVQSTTGRMFSFPLDGIDVDLIPYCGTVHIQISGATIRLDILTDQLYRQVNQAGVSPVDLLNSTVAFITQQLQGYDARVQAQYEYRKHMEQLNYKTFTWGQVSC